MKIKEHLVQSFTSPFANLLAIANLTMVAFVGAFGMTRLDSFGKLVHDLNAPALAVAVLLIGSYDCLGLVPPLIYLQWIFIGWLARVIARQIQPESV